MSIERIGLNMKPSDLTGAEKTRRGVNVFLLVMDCLMAVLGVIFIFAADFHYQYLPYLLGAVMIVRGVPLILYSVSIREYRTMDTNIMARGIMYCVTGVIVIARGNGAYGLIGVVWGVLGLFRSVNHLNLSIYRMANKIKNWGMPLFLSAVGFTLSILLLLDLSANIYRHMEYIGVELVYIGIVDILKHAKELSVSPRV